MAPHPESVPINELVRVAGLRRSPDGGTLDPFEFVRTGVAVARLMMPASTVRLSAGRTSMCDELQASAFTAMRRGQHLLRRAPAPGREPRKRATPTTRLLDRIGLRAG
ncbi:MAG: hypothetical protein IPN02_10210 [Candidatus Microthrix sp.]|uniref:Biotin and thiamin synthesis-associated domain-containing protein n=1 Tax=Candidatus Neomicrothrix subdominans TaxID=2954438 RepID=A0A936NBD3_9ACTN|nr:hypothetical protein [Candidatus Microthrix subdominans]